MNFSEEIATLGFPEGSYVVVGSGILNALGIRSSTDIDLIVTDEVFYSLADKPDWTQGRWGEKNVYQRGAFEVCNDWYGQNAVDLLKRARTIDDVPYLSLGDVYEWKKQNGREKDMQDVALIDEYRKKY